MYIAQSRVIQSFGALENSSKMDSFIGLMMCVLHCEVLNKNYFRVDMRAVSRHLDEVLYFKDDKPIRNDEKYWFLLMHSGWHEKVLTTFLNGTKISAYDFAALLYWNKPFSNKAELLAHFKSQLGSEEIYHAFFHDSDEFEGFVSSQLDTGSLYQALGGTGDSFTFKLSSGKGFIVKPAGDLTGAPFVQTLYANLAYRNIFIVCESDILDGYSLRIIPESQRSLAPANYMFSLPKPFLLLAGISGTGKTRFVRKQAEDLEGIVKNYKLISVRPDWHEPSDLLGYVSRISGSEKYVVTDTLKFIVSAWCDACDLNNTNEKVLANKSPAAMNTFWLCLDEMNLAPVEQYFADYLSVIETRKWEDESYTCDPILKADTIKLLKGAAVDLRNDLGLADPEYDSLWSYFCEVGIPLPPNLIVAGTVNMDETTHGFSRKVIDRALTLDFGQFFPNNFDEFFEAESNSVIFSFPTLSQASKSDFSDVMADLDGQKSLEFLKGINNLLMGTMFELAYRALNELLISVICIKPKTEIELQAVWDDFLMTKVLPRIEGDDDKLKIHNGSNSKEILKALDEYIKETFSKIYDAELRPDFFRFNKATNERIKIPCRSKSKLKWMTERLANNGFTTFWP